MQVSHLSSFFKKKKQKKKGFFNNITLTRDDAINDLGILPFSSILVK